jgi:hypothetical protein
MFEQSGDAIAVVDDSGVLATTLSVSDCRDMSAISDMDKTYVIALNTVRK